MKRHKKHDLTVKVIETPEEMDLSDVEAMLHLLADLAQTCTIAQTPQEAGTSKNQIDPS